MSQPFLGQISMFAGNFAPRSWAFCDGQLLAISQNQALFSLLGTIYGGDGRTTFALPDLRGRIPIHFGNGPGLSSRRIGEKGGAELHFLLPSELPAHTHSLQGGVTIGTNENAANSNEGAGNVLAAGESIYNSGPADFEEPLGGVSSNSLSVGNTGESRGHNNMSPFGVINFIIALQGIFPSRS